MPLILKPEIMSNEITKYPLRIDTIFEGWRPDCIDEDNKNFAEFFTTLSQTSKEVNLWLNSMDKRVNWIKRINEPQKKDLEKEGVQYRTIRRQIN
jgi:hypothetical protein